MRIAVLTAVILALVAGLALVGTRILEQPPAALPTPRPSVSWSVPALQPAEPPALRPAEPVLSPARELPVPGPDALARALAPGVADPAFGGRLAGIVVGADGRPRFSKSAGALLPPASTAKLATAVAALSSLNPDSRLRTSVVLSGRFVVLVGGGDPTLASAAAPRATPGLASLDALAAATAKKLLGTGARTVDLAYDTSRYPGPRIGPGWEPSYVGEGHVAPVTALMVDGGRVRPDERARHLDPAAAAARAFGARLAARGIPVVGVPRQLSAAQYAPGAELARVNSPRIRTLVERMLTSSDNTIAESLGREVAGAAALPRTFAGAAEGIRRAATGVGGDAAGLRLVDASGLSTLNRTSPAALAGLLVAAAARPAVAGLFAGLPVAGFSGTLTDRFRRGPAAFAAGLVRAKTGTLSGVSTLAGIVVDRAGTVLTFAFLAPRAPSRTRAEAALDRLAATLARL